MLMENQNNLNNNNNNNHNNNNFYVDLNLNNNNLDKRENLNEFNNNESKNINKDNPTNSDIFNRTINPHLDKIKKLKENLRTKIGLENSIGNTLRKNFDEEKYLSKFPSGAVEYGLPCEVVYKRGMEVINFFLVFIYFILE